MVVFGSEVLAMARVYWAFGREVLNSFCTVGKAVTGTSCEGLLAS